MTRKECEQKILNKIKEIREIYKEYNPDGDYLTISINPQTGYIAFNNAYYDTDAEYTLNYIELPDEEDT